MLKITNGRFSNIIFLYSEHYSEIVSGAAVYDRGQ